MSLGLHADHSCSTKGKMHQGMEPFFTHGDRSILCWDAGVIIEPLDERKMQSPTKTPCMKLHHVNWHQRMCRFKSRGERETAHWWMDQQYGFEQSRNPHPFVATLSFDEGQFIRRWNNSLKRKHHETYHIQSVYYQSEPTLISSDVKIGQKLV